MKISGSLGISPGFVIEGNSVPIVDFTDNRDVSEGNEISFQISASDPDHDSLTYRIIHGPDGANITQQGIFSWTAGSAPATQAITVGVSDGHNEVTQEFTLTVIEVPPVIAEMTNVVVNEGSHASSQVWATHPTQSLSYSVITGPGQVDQNGLWTLAASDGPSNQTVTIRVSRSEITYTDISFDVSVLNVSPNISVTGENSVHQDQTYTVNLGTVVDPGPDTVTNYRVNWGDGSSDNYSTGGNKTHTYTIAGSKTITVDLTDEDGVHMNCGSKVIYVEVVSGESIFNSTGTYNWTCPAGVTQVSVVAVGGGGASYLSGSNVGSSPRNGCGGGGGLGWRNNIPVTPGNSYTVVVGRGGYNDTVAGQTSYFLNSSTVAGFGGRSGPLNTRAAGGGYSGQGGGHGGTAGSGNDKIGGGGAGGYAGTGGGYGTSPSGGAGGAGYGDGLTASGGGGVGLFGQGTNGTNSSSALIGGTAGSGGGNGYGGVASVRGGNGGLYGGGAGGDDQAQKVPRYGGNGGVRIIWGAGRSFPNNAA